MPYSIEQTKVSIDTCDASTLELKDAIARAKLENLRDQKQEYHDLQLSSLHMICLCNACTNGIAYDVIKKKIP